MNPITMAPTRNTPVNSNRFMSECWKSLVASSAT